MIKPVDALLDKHEARIRELEAQEKVATEFIVRVLEAIDIDVPKPCDVIISLETVWYQVLGHIEGLKGELTDKDARIRELESHDEIHWKTRRTLLAERDRLAAELADVKHHDAAATSFVQDMVNALGWQERPDGTVSLDDLRDEVLHWLSQVKPTDPETPFAQSKSQQKRFEAHVPFVKEPGTELAAGCHRSHPHEDMDAGCQRLTEIARTNNAMAREKP